MRCAPMWTDLPEIGHNTPGQYIECTCKLTTNIGTMTNNIKIFKQVNAMQKLLLKEHKWFMQWVPRTRLPDGYLVTKRWPYLDHTWNQSLMNTSSVHASPRTNASQQSLGLQDLLEKLIHGVTYSRVRPITEDAAIDKLNTLCRGSALYPH